MIEIQVYLRVRSQLGAQDIEHAIRQAWSKVDMGAADVMLKLPNDALPALARAAEPDARLPHIILSLRGTSDALNETLAMIAPDFGTLAVPEQSSLLASRRHSILPGRDAVRLFFGLRRLSHLSLDEFHSYWLHHHADYGRRMIPPYSYHQLHADKVQTDLMAKTAQLPPSDLDGVAEVDFPDTQAMISQLSRPDVAQEALADERNFIDHSRSMLWAYQVI